MKKFKPVLLGIKKQYSIQADIELIHAYTCAEHMCVIEAPRLLRMD